ncbi:MAG: hypothetical protein ACRDNK_25040 [Solirubrobacteraceae bacterium]
MPATDRPLRDPETGELALVELESSAAGPDVFAASVEDGVVELIARVQRALDRPDGGSPRRIAVVVTSPPSDDPWEAAAADGLAQAVRGVVGAATLELGPQIRINTVLTRDRYSDATREALEFLAAGEASFAAGSTLDLRGA